MKIVILTGAGISAESGIKTFRDHDGLWENHRIEDVASPEGFKRDPETVYQFYNLRRQQLMDENIKPNAAHISLATLENAQQHDVLIVTQNIDNLHERAGSQNLIHMHGELMKARCDVCVSVLPCDYDFDNATSCPACQRSGGLRPHVVWFGEMPLEMDRIFKALSECDVFAAIGTSGQVYPAAGFVDIALQNGAKTWELNLEPTGGGTYFNHTLYGQASEMVPAWTKQILNAG